MISSLYTDKNSTTNKFTEKMSAIVVKIAKGDKSKSVGQINLNLSNFIDGEPESMYEKKIKLPIEKCPDKNAYLEIMMKSTIINVASGSDAMSALSGLDGMSMESGPDSESNFDLQSRAHHRKERAEETAMDIDDIGEIGVGSTADAPNLPKPESSKKFSSYR